MKYIVITDQPIVLEKIRLQGHNEIRQLEDNDYLGESGKFIEIAGAWICPKCGQSFGIWYPPKYCISCGCRNESV